MRILYYVSIHDNYMYQWQRVHILDELRRGGVEFVEFDPEKFQTAEEAISSFKSLLQRERFDLFMTGYGHTYVTPALLVELRGRGVPSLLFCSDNLLVPFEHLSIAPHFDLAWLTARETEYLFRWRGAKTIFLPYAANPQIYSGAAAGAVNRALFIGSPYGSRANVINALASHEVNIDLYGGGSGGGAVSSGVGPGLMEKNLARFKAAGNLLRFPVGRKVLLGAMKQKIAGTSGIVSSPHIHRHPGLDFEHMYEAYAKYAVSLASTAARNTGVLKEPVNVINLRSFEIPMAGGVQLCAYSDELAEYFEDGREIVFYRSEAELVEKARYLTGDRAANDVSNIRKHARERALRDHTWTKRFNKVFARLGIPQLAGQQ